MRYIDKSKNPCEEFIAFVKEHNLEKWDDLDNCGMDGSDIKKTLHNHLVDEQHGLCIYCEQEIQKKADEKKYYERGHIEHVMPKDDNRFPHLTYVYENLAVSCAGYDSKQKKGEQFCGHKKGNEYDEELFLNPFQQKDIAKYFIYEEKADGFWISPNPNLNSEEKGKAEYMIKERILDLNHRVLCDLRKNVYDIFLAETDDGLDDDKIKDLLNEDETKLYQFHSMLKYLSAHLFLAGST